MRVPLLNRDGEVVAHAVIDRADSGLLAWVWRLSAGGYAYRSVGRTKKVWMHREVAGDPPGLTVDHIDRDTLNNRRSNLRAVTHAENCQNRAAARGDKLRGVVRTRSGRFQAHARLNYKRVTIGTFDTAEEAVAAVTAWRRVNMPMSMEAAP